MKVLFFDGHCNLCNGFIDFLISRDLKHVLKFAPLQGRTSSEKLPAEYREKLETVVYMRDGKVHIRSTAALLAIADMGGAYGLLKIFLAVPPSIRDLVYRFVAHNRYQWFGRRDSCRLPSPEERAQFLD